VRPKEIVQRFGREFQKPLRCCGWWSLNRQKIAASPADYWIFMIVRSTVHTDFIIIKPAELLNRLDATHGQLNRIQSYLYVTERRTCWETRGLNRSDQLSIAEGRFKNNSARDFSAGRSDDTKRARICVIRKSGEAFT
jgi:hypothetical protein